MTEVVCYRHAVFTATLEDEHSRKYGLTAGHVMQAADGVIMLNDSVKLGEGVPTFTQLTVDVGLFDICPELYDNCQNKVYDPDGCLRTCKLYTGSLKELYNRQVFKSIPQKTRVIGPQERTSVFGTIASGYIHQTYSDIINKHNFLVTVMNDRETFAVAGESGTPICLDIGDNDVYLVGSITGQIKLDKPYIKCAYLPYALKILSDEKKRLMKLSQSYGNDECAKYRLENEAGKAHGSVRENACAPAYNNKFPQYRNESEMIFCCRDIFFKSVEIVSKTDFEIDEQLCTLMCLNFDSDDHSSVMTIKDCEQSFRHKIFARDLIDDQAIFEPDKAEQKALIYFYLTVQCLYAQNLKNANILLKEAIRCLGKVHESQLRLVSKCITYATWYYLCADEDERLKNVLSYGLDFYNSHRDTSYFPIECLGYHCYDYSRYYTMKGNQSEAIRMGEMSHRYLKQNWSTINNTNQLNAEVDKDAFNRYIFGVCQYAQSLLWCGESFEYSGTVIQKDRVAAAKNILNSVRERIKESSTVQQVCFLLAECDLLFRESDYHGALEKAKLSFEWSKRHDIHEEQCMAGKRIMSLKKHIKKSRDKRNGSTQFCKSSL